jgi:glycosyltransferase involved in cell wall biosynthesis
MNATQPRTTLHIVEPTLSGDSGHCMSLVRALSDAAVQTGLCDVTVWGGRAAAAAHWPGPAQLMAHFDRRWRRFQALGLYRRLLGQPGRILVATASSADFVSLDWAARWSRTPTIAPNKVALFVHWVNAKPGKARLFKKIARRQPNLKVLAPTTSVASFFADCGFATQVVPYPLDLPDHQPAQHAMPFRHLLVAGGARMDKGFGHIVALVEEMERQGLTLPITVQTSLEDRHHKDQALADALMRLRTSNYPGLTLRQDTMDREAYRAMFDGAVVIQPYRTADFQDRVSGVTLDAMGAGAPVVVTEGTWMARLAQRHQAGVATADLSPSGLLDAIHTILADHAGFADRARVAAAAVQSEHSARGLVDAVLAGD